MTEKSTAVAVSNQASLIERTGSRFGLSGSFVVKTLKATAFRTSQAISDEQLAQLLVVSEQYRLNPFTKELFAYPDKGGIVPVVSVDGWARIINEHPQFNGMRFVYDAADGAMTCIMHRKDREYPTEVTEYMAECKRNTGPWQSHPRRMLRHKAMIQAARMAFGFAGIYDEDEAHRVVGAPSNGKGVSSQQQRVRDAINGAPSADLPIVEEVIPAAEPAPLAQAQLDLLADYRRALAELASADEANALMEEASTLLEPQALAQLAQAYSEKFAA